MLPLVTPARDDRAAASPRPRCQARRSQRCSDSSVPESRHERSLPTPASVGSPSLRTPETATAPTDDELNVTPPRAGRFAEVRSAPILSARAGGGDCAWVSEETATAQKAPRRQPHGGFSLENLRTLRGRSVGAVKHLDQGPRFDSDGTNFHHARLILMQP